MINTLLVLLIVLWGASLYLRRRKIQDADAMAWATAAEPFVVMSRHHNDKTVSSEAANIREQLRIHGNQNLKTPDTGGYEFAVLEHVYSADELTTSRDFNVWLDLAIIQVKLQREAFREQKRQWNAEAAKQQFAGQTINPKPSIN